MLKLIKLFYKLTVKPLLKSIFIFNKISKTKSSSPYTLKNLCYYSLKLKQNSLKPSTIDNKKHLHKMLFAILKDIHIIDFTRAKAYELITILQENSLKVSTINQLISYANEGINLALDLGIISQNPLKNIKKFLKPSKNIKTNKTIKNSHIKTLLTKATGELKTFLYFAFFTGARASEILALTNKDINYKNNLIKIHKNATRFGITSPKNGTSRLVPLANSLKIELLKCNFKCFTSNYFAINYQFNKLKKQENLKIGSLHTARHTYASNCLHLKLDLPLIARFLGHKDTTMLTRVYSHEIHSPQEIRKIKNLLYFK